MIKLNKYGLIHAEQLISQGKIDYESDWSFSAEDGNKILGDPSDWDEYRKWFLAVDDDAGEDTKAHYKYPYGKNGKVYRKGVIAIKQRAAQQGERDIEDAAAGLLDMIDARDKNAKGVIRRLNYHVEAGVDVDLDPSSVPTLVPKHILDMWHDGDDNPYYKIQKIKYPIVANGLIYTREFFESFVDKLRTRPIPGSKGGHVGGWGERPPTDFILVGGKLEDNGDETGYVYFKNYIPPKGESGDNSVFIRENKSGMIHYSLVTVPEEREEDGRIYVIRSLYGERNDAVEYGMGAMEQVTNASVAGTEKTKITKEQDVDIKLVKNAIEKGEIKPADLGLVPIAEVEELRQRVKNAMLTEFFGPAGEGNLVRLYAERVLKDVDYKEIEKHLNALKDDPIIKKLASEQADNNIGVTVPRPTAPDMTIARDEIKL